MQKLYWQRQIKNLNENSIVNMSRQINAAKPNPQISGRSLVNYLKLKVKLCFDFSFAQCK